MKFSFAILTFIVLLFNFSYVQCFFDPVSLTAIGIAAGTISSLIMLFSKDEHGKSNFDRGLKLLGQQIGVFEGCEDYWIPGNLRGLENDLKENIFGQKIAVDLVLSSLKRHLDHRSPPKRALMLSFHGSPGTGKNFISQKILRYMFLNGPKTEYVHFFKGAIDFPSANRADQYKEEIIKQVKDKVYECKRSMFVFDEVEKMPSGLLDVLSSFVKAETHNEYDFRRVIFILLSNVGTELLVNITKSTISNGQDRDNLDGNTKALLAKTLAGASFNLPGGLQNTGLVKSHGISHYVPFLPMESHHVTECLKREVAKQGQVMSQELSRRVMEQIHFSGPFASAGCKNIGEIAFTLIEEQIQRRTINSDWD